MMGYADFHMASTSLPLHYHHNQEFVVIIKGNQQYTVNDRRYILYGGDIFSTYPEELHSNKGNPQDICEFVWFQIDLSKKENFLGLPEEMGSFLYSQLVNYKRRITKASTKDLLMLKRSFFNFSYGDISHKVLAYTGFIQFLINNICISKSAPMQAEDLYSPDISEAISYIQANLTNDLSVSDIARKCSLSESRLKAKFKSEVGVTPLNYINCLKIDTAKILLKSSDASITDIAFQLGFSSSNYFSSVFRKYTTYTPKEFRKKRLVDIY